MPGITTLPEPCWTLVRPDGRSVADIEPHYDSETKALDAIGYYLDDDVLTPMRLDQICSTATLACGYVYDVEGEGIEEHWSSADELRDHLIKNGYRPGADGSLRCPANYDCDECDALPDVPDHSPVPGQIDLLAASEEAMR